MVKSDGTTKKTILSTPHGALGTQVQATDKFYIYLFLSTPHGALGTGNTTPTIRPPLALSTPHGALGTLLLLFVCVALCPLSTPHGALGTREDWKSH